jgi:transcriptional regulator with XRE-family HTH domain
VATTEGLETIAQTLVRLRKERGLTQAQMAKRLGVSQPVVSDYERGGLRLHGELILRVAEILDVSANELLGLDTKAVPNKHGPPISTGKADGCNRFIAAQGTTAAFGCGRSLHITARRALILRVHRLLRSHCFLDMAERAYRRTVHTTFPGLGHTRDNTVGQLLQPWRWV